MKALVIAPQPFFSPRGTPFSVYYRTLVTSELGVDIDLLTYGEGQDVEIANTRIIRVPRFKFLGNVKTGPSLLKLLLDQFMILWTIALLIRHRYDVVHAHEESVFWVRFLKPIFRFKMVYDMHSSLPQQLENFNFSRSKLLHSIFKKLEDTSIYAADAIITICPALADYVDGLIGKQEKHFLIENSIFEDVRLANKKNTAPAVEQKNAPDDSLLAGKKLVVYTGTLEHYQGIDTIVNAIPDVVAQHPEVVFLIVGGNPQQVDKYKSIADELQLDDKVIFTGRVAQTQAKKYNAMATILLSPRVSGNNTPLKIYEQLASEKPLVATNIFSHTQVLTDDIAFLIEPTAQGMAQGILDALADEQRAQAKAQAAKRVYEEKYSRPVYTGKMQRLLELLQ